jgi:hypothetical protein
VKGVDFSTVLGCCMLAPHSTSMTLTYVDAASI